ncbi:hypothetical protein VNI00_005157 [Paramarasmius palmivorus]|uniref:AIG1-type G domain-containing protein n=1 Tax=Paramarasmius palmivorus TaxID=297713 RepID=A0AAW0DH75_9AGAR
MSCCDSVEFDNTNTMQTTYTEACVTEECAPTRTMTLGPWRKQEMNIILLGESGVGKTAFLDLLGNVCAGVELDGFKPVHDLRNEAVDSKGINQTDDPKLYRIDCANGHRLNILDTPGTIVTRGIDHDKGHTQAIANVIKKSVQEVDAVIILVNGTQPRLTPSTEYALSVISGLFPDSIDNNVGLVFTMVSDPVNFCFEHSSLPEELQQAPGWMINNPFARWTKYQRMQGQMPSSNMGFAERMERSIREDYDKTFQLLFGPSQVEEAGWNNPAPFFQWLDGCGAQPTFETYHMRNMNTGIEASIANVIERMNQAEKMCSELMALNDNLVQEQAKKVTEQYEPIVQAPVYVDEGPQTQDISNYDSDRTVEVAIEQPVSEIPYAAPAPPVIESTETDRLPQQKVECDCMKGKSMKEQRYYGPEPLPETEKLVLVMEDMAKDISRRQWEIRGLEHELFSLSSRYNSLAFSGSFVGNVSFAMRLLIKDQDATRDALDRMSERIERLEGKRQVVQNDQVYK